MTYSVHVGDGRNKGELKSLFQRFTAETGCPELYDDAHCDGHVSKILESGLAFILRKGDAAIGMVTCHFIDAGYRMLADLETTHTYVVSDERSYIAVSALLKFVEDYAERQGVAVLFSQCDYRAAVAGEPGNSARVQKLYKMRGYRGPIGVVYAAPRFVPVGVTFLFNGIAAEDIKPLPGVRRVPFAWRRKRVLRAG